MMNANVKIICAVNEGGNIENILPDMALEGEKIGVKRLYDTSAEVEKFLESESSDSNVNLSLGKSDEAVIKKMLSQMPNYEKGLYNTFELNLPDGLEPEELIKYLNDHNDVDYAELDEINFKQEIKIDYNIPNDPLYDYLYGIKNLECLSAWKKTEGDEVLVAVVDSGVDYNHPDIKNNMWQNQNGEYGFNFVNNTSDPLDDDGHGTHVAGTIAATGNNKIGIIGVAPKAKIMALKGLSPNGGFGSNLAKCIKYAVDHGASIINNSWGPGKSIHVRRAIEYADRKGVIVLFAAGNENEEITADMAAGYSRTISVAAVNRRDSRASFSNYGKLVDISAPGVSIQSLRFNSGDYTGKSGTSMACPHVAGIVALIKSLKPKIKKKEVLSILQKYSDSHFSDSGKYIGQGRVNARKVTNSLNSKNENIEVVDFNATIDVQSNLYLLNIELKNQESQELKFNSIMDLESSIFLIKNYKTSYSLTENKIMIE